MASEGDFCFRLVIALFRNLREEIELIKQRDPAARNGFEIWLTYSGLHAVRSYKIGRAHV